MGSNESACSEVLYNCKPMLKTWALKKLLEGGGGREA